MHSLSTNLRQENSRHCAPHLHNTFHYSAFILLSAAGYTSILHNEGLALPHTDCNNGEMLILRKNSREACMLCPIRPIPQRPDDLPRSH